MSADDPLRILIVCVGNQCRSPLAERLLRARLAPFGERVVVASAGTFGPPGEAMDPSASAELARLGGDPSGFVSRRVSQELLLEQDLVLTMTRALRKEVLQLAPRALRRTFALTEFAAILTRDRLQASNVRGLVDLAGSRRASGASGQDIDDPIGRPSQVHAEVADQIAACIEAIVGAVRG